MKIVKFKNGKYGVRRFNWDIWSFEFEFCTNAGIFNSEHPRSVIEFNSLKEAEGAMSKAKQLKARRSDIGKPV